MMINYNLELLSMTCICMISHNQMILYNLSYLMNILIHGLFISTNVINCSLYDIQVLISIITNIFCLITFIFIFYCYH